MPHLLMGRCYDYDDEFSYEQDGGYPQLVFTDNQFDAAIAELTARQQQEWPNCTPLNTFYQDQSLADLSTSGLDDDTLAAGISAVLNEPLSADKLLEYDFTVRALTDEQQRTIGLMLDRVGTSYLQQVPCYKGV